jgi:hypothetical protein
VLAAGIPISRRWAIHRRSYPRVIDTTIDTSTVLTVNQAAEMAPCRRRPSGAGCTPVGWPRAARARAGARLQ